MIPINYTIAGPLAANWAPEFCWWQTVFHIYSWIYMFIGSGYILELDIFCQQLEKYSDIGYILPTIGGYILVLDIFCQQLGDIYQLWGVCAPFGRRAADCAFTRMCII